MDENNDVHRVDECEICLNLVNQNKLLIMWAKSPRSSYVSSYSGQIGNQVAKTIAGARKVKDTVIELSEILTEQQIDHVVLKGFPLSTRLYHDDLMRGVGDIDILVQRDSLNHVLALLTTKHGYSFNKDEFPRGFYNLAVQGKTGIVVELHWCYDNFGLSHKFVKESLASAEIVEGVPALNQLLSSIYLLEHAGKSAMRVTLLHYIDLAQALSTLDCKEIDSFFAQVSKRKIMKMLGVAVDFLDYIGLKVPERYMERVHVPPNRIARYFRQSIMQSFLDANLRKRKVADYFLLYNGLFSLILRGAVYKLGLKNSISLN